MTSKSSNGTACLPATSARELVLCALGLMLACGHALAAAVETVWTDPSQLRFEALTAPLFIDLDGDGSLEIVVGGWGAIDELVSLQSAVSVYSRASDGSIQHLFNRAVPNRLLGMAGIEQPSGAAGILTSSSGFPQYGLHEFTGPALDRRRSAFLPSGSVVAQVADLDADGELEILTGPPLGGFNGGVRSINYATLAQEWLVDALGSLPSAHQLDQDPALEVIVRGPPGRILDGATGSSEFAWPAGFGSRPQAGRFESDPSILGWAASTDRLTFFRASPYSPTRELEVPQALLAAYDADGDDRDELYALGVNGSNLVKVSVVDGSVEWLTNVTSTATPPGPGRLVQGEAPVAVLEGRATSAELVSFRLFDLETSQDRYAAPIRNGARNGATFFQPAAPAGPMVAELAAQRGPMASRVSLELRDLDSGALVTSSHIRDEGFNFVAPVLLAADIDGVDGDELVAIDSGLYSTWVAVIDGETLAVLWQLDDVALFPSHILAWHLVDWNGDAVQDVVLTLWDGLLDRPFVIALSGTDGTELWRSGLLADPGGKLAGMLARTDAGAAPEVVVSLPDALFGFGPASTQPTWVVAAGAGETFEDVVSWGSGEDCRLGVRLAGADLLTLGCEDRLPKGQIDLPAGTDWMAPLDPLGQVLAATADGGLWLAFEGQPFRLELDGLGAAVRANWPWGMRFVDGDAEFLLGSPLELRRVRLTGDTIFVAGFEVTP